MNLRFLPLVLALTTVAPMAVQAQRMPNPQEMPAPDLRGIPKDLKFGTTISGTITAKDIAYVTKEFGQVKCSQFRVILRESDPDAGQSKSPDSYDMVVAQATGNHLELGCKYSLTVPDSAKGKQGYLRAGGIVRNKEGNYFWMISSPQGWQNPMPVPGTGDTGRNLVVDVLTIK